MAETIKLLPRYWLTFGLFWGSRMFVQLEILHSISCKIKGVSYPVFLRKNSTDLKVFREIFLFKSYNVKFASSPRVIIDGGGNIGLTSIYFANKFPESQIVSVEPDLANFHMLCKNVKPYQKVIPIHAALWYRNTHLRIVNKDDSQWAFAVEECDASHPEAIKGISIPFLMEQEKIDHIDVLKLDIEGSEKELFSTDHENWINDTKCIIVEMHDWLRPGSSQSVFKAMAGYSFNTSILNGMLMMTNQGLN
jgi:FkbM family methyltransferase